MPASASDDAPGADLLRRSVAHMAWADARVAAVLTRHDVPEATRLFAHLAGAAALWLARIDGTASPLAVWPEDLLPDAAMAHLARAHADFAARLAPSPGLDVRLARRVAYVNTKGEAFENTVADIVAHVVQHAAYHRGQIARALRAADVEPPYTDYIQFVRAPDA